MKITVQPRQCIFDIALLTSGDLQASVDIAAQNDTSITYEQAIGKVIDYKENAQTQEKNIIAAYQQNKIVPATWLDEEDRVDGIEFWTIGVDFIVSE